MNDAIALLAISQLVCLAAMIYLYTQLQAVKTGVPRRRVASGRVQPMARSIQVAARRSASQAARQAYSAPQRSIAGRPAGRPDTASIAARMTELGMDIPALAGRLQKSEEEVRLLLRRGGLSSRELAG